MRYKGQPGVDSGGLMRQAFTTVFKMLANNEVPGIRLFTGPPNTVTPLYRSENLLTNIFETIGKMVSHSLVQGGPGFPAEKFPTIKSRSGHMRVHSSLAKNV